MAVHGDAADLSGLVFAEPEIAVAHHRRERAAAGREASGEFRHHAAGRDPANAADVGLGEPHVSIRAGDDAVRSTARGRNGKLGDRAGRGDPPDPVAGVLAEPQRAVGRGRDPDRPAVRRGRIELDEAAVAGVHPPDLGCPALAEPEVPVRAERDDVRLAVRGRNRMQNDLDVSHHRYQVRPIAPYCAVGEPYHNPGGHLKLAASQAIASTTGMEEATMKSLGIGLVIYFAYGRKHSVLRHSSDRDSLPPSATSVEPPPVL